MPLLNGIEAARQIRKSNSNVKIIFLTMHPDVTFATEALAAGGSGYVLKNSAGDELLTAIQRRDEGAYLRDEIDRGSRETWAFVSIQHLAESTR